MPTGPLQFVATSLADEPNVATLSIVSEDTAYSVLHYVQPVVAVVHKLERVRGIEPRSSTWKEGILPLNYTRKIGVPERNQTPICWFETSRDLRFTTETMVARTGLEPVSPV